VQVVWSTHAGKRDMTQVGTARSEVEVELLKAKGAQMIAGGQGELALGVEAPAEAALEIASSRMGVLWDALVWAYEVLRFDKAAGGDEVFRDLVLARIVEPTSKLDSLRVLGEIGIAGPSYRTVNRRLASYARMAFRDELARACARHAELGPNALVLFDCTTLYYECHQEDEFRKPGFSKERRLEPQITVALLTDRAGFPLMVQAFEGNKAETKTILPVIEAYAATHELRDVTVVADAGMLSDANLKAIERAGWSFVVGLKIPEVPFQVAEWVRRHPGQGVPDGQVLVQAWPAGSKSKAGEWTDVYQYRDARARRASRGIDTQIAKAERAARGEIPVKRNRFVSIDGADIGVNRALEAKTRTLAGWRGYTTNLQGESTDFIIAAYHHLYQVEKSFRMSKHDLRARPIYSRTRDSIEAHLTIVFAAMAIGRWVEDRTGWSIKKFVRTLRRYKTIQIKVGNHVVTAADPLPDDVRDALAAIHEP
jgi:hypothetical protein